MFALSLVERRTPNVSQRNIELLIGRLLTDDEFGSRSSGTWRRRSPSSSTKDNDTDLTGDSRRDDAQ